MRYKLTLTVDREIVDELKRRGVCISRFLESAARDLIENSKKAEEKGLKSFFKRIVRCLKQQ